MIRCEDKVEEIKDDSQVSVLSDWGDTVNTALYLGGYVPKSSVDA